MSDESIVISACMRFPHWGSQPALVSYANATVFHNGDAVGWLRIDDLMIANSQTNLTIHEVFHISDQHALERLTSDVAVSRRVVVNIRATVDLSGFGRFLPVIFVRHSLDMALPPPPAMQLVAVDGLRGPAPDATQGGVTAHATILATLPPGFAANIDALRFDVGYNGVSIASADIGPVSIAATGAVAIPASVNIKHIAGQQHEDALADMVRNIAAGKGAELSISGAPATDYQTAPTWLRRALRNVVVPFNASLAQIPLGQLPSLGALVSDIVVNRLYAFWSAEDSFNPRASLAGHALVGLPNPTDADIILDVESLVGRLELLDEALRIFAVVDTTTAPILVSQTAPLAFNVSCNFDNLGLGVVSGREQVFTRTMKKALVDRHLAVGINGSLDISLMTSIGRLRVDMLPIFTSIDYQLESSTLSGQRNSESSKVPEIRVARIHITNTTKYLVSAEIGLDIDNPLSYGAYMSDLALMIRYSGLHIATVGVKELSLERGQNNATVYVDFHNHPSDPRQQMLFLEASSGKRVDIELAGFPNCTSIAPLEASLRHFSQRITIDPSRVDNRRNGPVSVKLPRVLREAVFHIFGMSAEATVVNPVSGADIWLQAIEAIGYYKGDIPLGSLRYDFVSDTPSSRVSGSPGNGFLMPFNRAVTTPRLPITANETSIGWDVVRKAIGGTLGVDVFTNLQVLVGNAPLNLTVLGRGAPVKPYTAVAAMNEADIEFDRARRKSQGRFRSAFEAIFEKYGHIDENDDIVDLRSGRLIVDNGRLRAAGVIELGDLLRHSGSSPPLAHIDERYSISPELGMQTGEDERAVSPELLSNTDISTHRSSGLLKRLRSEASDSDSLDLEFDAPDATRSRQRRSRQRRVVNRRYGEENGAVGYESSDSLATDLDTPIDVYFTSSVEQYLDKLRQQVATPKVLGTLESGLRKSDIEDDIYSGGSSSEQSDSAESGYILRDLNGGQRRYTLYSYTIPSSPHTMTTLSSNGNNSGSWRNASPELGSEVSESSRSEFSMQLLEEYDVASPDRVADESLPAAYDTLSVDYFERQGCYGSKVGFCGDIADDNADEGEYSTASPNAYSSYAPWGACSPDLSPGFNLAAAARADIKPLLHKPDSPPLTQAKDRSMWNPNELYGNRALPGLSVQSHQHWCDPPNDAAAFTSSGHFPVVFKPRPVAPHVFFERDGTALNSGRDSNNGNSALGVASSSVYENDDNMAEDTVIVVRDEYEDDDDSDCSGESPHFEAASPGPYNYMTK
ncbi:hypothetical protein GGF41_001686 [Coemansia sp. RSA 2531]|nr:hypothetical protein GGF41_001686 [Coemansia sp. RSA 2531]